MAKIKIGNVKGPMGERGATGARGDTGERGLPGATGARGAPGKDGKSAYQYAKEAGYSGSENEFAALLNMNNGHITDRKNPHAVTAAQVGADVSGAAQVVQGKLQTHMIDAVKHVTAEERTAWGAKASASHKHAASDMTSGTLAVARGGTGSQTVAGARANLAVSSPVTAMLTLAASGWSLSSGAYQQTVSCGVAQVNMKVRPLITLNKSTDLPSAKLQQEAFSLISRADTGAASVKFTCGADKPQVNLNVFFDGGIA